jgi:putative transposase
LAKDDEQPWINKLNAHARQAAAERAWQSVASFYRRCKAGEKKKGFPKFKKHSRSVEYKVSGWKLSEDGNHITFTDGFKAGTFELWMNGEARQLITTLKLNRVRVVKKADGYYTQFCIDAERTDKVEHTGEVVGIDLGLKFFTKDSRDAEVECPKFLRKAERRLKHAQRKLSKKLKRGVKGQSKNYHKQRQRVGKIHLKVQRQRNDFAIKQARCVVKSNDFVAYEDLKVSNMVKNHHLAKSIMDAGWSQYTQWLDYYGKLWDKIVVAVPPQYTSQDCSSCGHRVKKTLSTRTHSCSSCGLEMCRDQNAAINILKRGMAIVGAEYNNSTEGHSESAEQSGKIGEMSTSAFSESSLAVSTVGEPITVRESPHL